MKYSCEFQVPRMSLWDSIFGKPLHFYGKGSVALQETGLVVHGDLAMFLIPFVGRFYSALISETTMRTVPYSKIVQHKATGRWISISLIKFLFLLAWFLITGFLFAVGMLESMEPLIDIPLGLAAFVIIPLVILMFDRGTHYITFCLPSGKRSQFAIRLSPLSSDQMAAFTNTLEEYQIAAIAFENHPSIREAT